MPRLSGFGSAVHVGNDFVEADLDIAFSLLAAAEMHTLSREGTHTLRMIEEAEKAIADGEQRLPALDHSDRERLHGRLTRMRGVIQGIRANLY